MGKACDHNGDVAGLIDKHKDLLYGTSTGTQSCMTSQACSRTASPNLEGLQVASDGRLLQQVIGCMKS